MLSVLQSKDQILIPVYKNIPFYIKNMVFETNIDKEHGSMAYDINEVWAMPSVIQLSSIDRS